MHLGLKKKKLFISLSNGPFNVKCYKNKIKKCVCKNEIQLTLYQEETPGIHLMFKLS